jgi:death on curing protein
MNTYRYLTAQEAIFINLMMIQLYSPGEQVGVKSAALLDSAVMRPQATVFGEDAYPSIYEKAAALFESLGQNHPFQNANKRTAYAALQSFLKANGLRFQFDPVKAAEFTVDMVNHKYTFEELVEVIRTNSIPK